MSELNDKLHKLKLVMDETVTFPTQYIFKFIVPIAEVNKILFILNGMELEEKASNKGNFISITARSEMQTSDDIIKIYRMASGVKGVISL